MAQEGGDIIYLGLVRVFVWQKPPQHWKANILQFKKREQKAKQMVHLKLYIQQAVEEKEYNYYF